MKTLERFWQWHDNEKPDWARVSAMQSANLSGLARYALSLAATIIDCRHDERQSLGMRFCDREILEEFPEALRDLSLRLCPALEATYAAVAPRERPEFSPADLPYVTAWYKPATCPGVGSILRINDRLLEIDREARQPEPRATLARVLRLRLYHDALEGPHWLTLLCQCAWLRGVVGHGVPAG